MTKWNAAVGLNSDELAGISGLHRRALAVRPSLPQGPVASPERESGGDSAKRQPVDMWQRVDKCIQRLALRDPRRRLLELARMRHDVSLAKTILENM
jgi:hypothetical protein